MGDVSNGVLTFHGAQVITTALLVFGNFSLILSLWYASLSRIMKNEDNRTWSSMLTREMVVKVLLPLSIFAASLGTFPTDATFIQSLVQSQGLTEDAAAALVLFKSYSAMLFIFPVVLFTMKYGAKPVMFSGAFSQLACLGFWTLTSQYHAVAQVCCVFAGYGAAAWIACICLGRYLLPKEYYLLYYAVVGSSYLAAQFPSTVLQALVKSSVLDPGVPFYYGLVGAFLAILICFCWVPNQQHVYSLQGVVDMDAGGPPVRSLGTCEYWRQMGADFLAAAIATKTFVFLIVCYMFEYAIYLSIQATIADFFSGSEADYIDPISSGFVMAFGAVLAAVMTAAPLVMRTGLSGNQTERFVIAMGSLSSMFIAVLPLMQMINNLAMVGYIVFLMFITIACVQFTASVVKIITCAPFELSVMLHGAMMLVATGTKVMLTRHLGLPEAYVVYAICWIAFSLLLSVVVLLQCCLKRLTSPETPQANV